MRELFQMLDNSGPIARTAPAPYPIVDCEKMSAQGLTCNSVSSRLWSWQVATGRLLLPWCLPLQRLTPRLRVFVRGR